ncbi:MAG: ABC transporter ATP-binding protein [Ignavibacteria bacterium]|nr:ABC transporter ATP-binding protein [Ignavibacteria bacterium]MDH7527259.1 ABC transporter ATP-binding protein [Ignavibacteria bacterium]NPV11956.1 ABC transporter ATP-binding protein [Ignavibacteria bacterium]
MNLNSDNQKVLINAIEIKKSYVIENKNRLEVLKGISLEIYENEILEIVGASGAGKSTLLHILGTIDKPDEGKIYFYGQDLLLMKDEELSQFRNQNIGFVFQFHHLLPEFTALENVIIPMMINRKSFDEAKPRAIELLEYVGLGERLNHKPSELSGGELQRVAIARALANNPKVIFADEPTGNLDTQNSQNIIQLIQNLNRELGQTFVIVTHNPEMVGIAHRVMEIKDGMLSRKLI